MANPAAAYDAIIASVLAAGPGAAGGVEAAFAGVIGQVIAVAPPAAAVPDFTFPDNAAIRAELTSTPANWPVVITHHLDDFVVPQFQAIPDLPVPGASGAAATAWNTAPQIDKIVRKASDLSAFTPPPTNNLPKAVITRFDYKLHQLQPSPGDDIANGWQLVKAYTGGAGIPAAAHASQAAAVQTINNLAAFEGFCIRLASAITAASRARVSLAEALALWRTEGDLCVPYAETRRAAGAPTCDVIGNQIDKISLGDDTAEVFPGMHRGLWSYTLSHPRFIGRLPAGATPSTVSDAAKLMASIHWSIVAAGLDFFWQRIPVRWDNRAASVAAIGSFLNANHLARWSAGGSTAADLAAQYTLVLDDLVVSAAPHNRIVVAPTTPAALVALLLGEALIFFDLDTAGGRGPVLTPTAKLKYLAYHCQDHRHPTDVAEDKFTLMLVSAAVAAARGPAGALQLSLDAYARDPAFPKSAALKPLDFKKPAAARDPSVHLAAYGKLDAGGWWTAANLDNLADFILIAATPAPWEGWEELRGNMARYAKLRAFYDALLS